MVGRYHRKKTELLKENEKQCAVAYEKKLHNAELNDKFRYVVLGYFVVGADGTAELPNKPLSQMPYNIGVENARQMNFSVTKTIENVPPILEWYQRIAASVNAGSISFKQGWWIAMFTQNIEPELFFKKLKAGYVPYCELGGGKVYKPVKWVKIDTICLDDLEIVSGAEKLFSCEHKNKFNKI